MPLRNFGVDRQHLGWLIDELVVGAYRLKVIDQLSHEVRELENAANAKWEEIAERQVRTASSTLNGYVSALGFDRLVMLATVVRHIEQVLWTPVVGSDPASLTPGSG